MLELLYEDKDVIVVKKPVGMESQAAGGFAPDMVSEIKKHIHNLYPGSGEPYVGVIHRLDKPVGWGYGVCQDEKSCGRPQRAGQKP